MFVAGTHESGGAMNIWNRQGVPIFIAGFGKDNQSGEIQLRNRRGNTIFTVGAAEEGGGLITLMNEAGRKPRTFSALK